MDMGQAFVQLVLNNDRSPPALKKPKSFIGTDSIPPEITQSKTLHDRLPRAGATTPGPHQLRVAA